MKQLFAFLLIISVLGSFACKSSQQSKRASAPVSTPTSGKRTPLVKASDLESLLPQEVLGLTRTNLTGERAEISDKNVMTASAEYKNTERVLRITITDATRAVAGLTGLAPWVAGEVDNKWEQGYERTVEIDGYKGYESYTRGDQTGQTSVVVNNRFVVSVVGEKVAEGEPREALRKIDLKRLARMK
ncbi:MAG: hypothetical protein ACK4TA_02925 [Saprospiraceae bacterium]